MTATLVIVFREVFEIALVLSILAAATHGLPRRTMWISSGVAVGAAGAVLVALFAQAIASAAEGVGQELFNAIVLFLAVAMLGWHNVWMSRQGAALATETGAMAESVRTQERPVWILAVIAATATVREGAEVVLFLHGIAASQQSDAGAMLTGGIGGLLLGAALGIALYLGLVQLSGRLLFGVTSWLILFLAAGMAAEGARFLVQAGMLPPLGTPPWDSSFLLSEGSALGRVLHALAGYVARPMPIQLIFYLGTLITIGTFMKLMPKPSAGVARGKTYRAPAEPENRI